MASQKVDNNLLAPYFVEAEQQPDGSQRQVVAINNGFLPPKYDQIELGYTGANLTSVIYKLSSVTVATLALSYTGADLTGVVKS